MKVVWIVLGVLVFLCAVCAGGGYFLFNKGKAVFDEGGKFGDDTFRAVAANWSTSEAMQRASDGFKRATPEADLEKVFSVVREKIGPLKGEFKSTLSKINNDNGVVTAEWDADAQGEKAAFSCNMRLINEGGQWKLLYIGVESPALRESGSSKSPVTSAPEDNPKPEDGKPGGAAGDDLGKQMGDG